MRSRASSSFLRVACVVSVSALLVIGPIGCGGGGSDNSTGTTTQLPPEMKNANEAMENAVKNQQKNQQK